MKTPLRYQLSEYDCGPTSLLNAVNFLFEREDIPPEILRNVMLYCLDCYGAEGSFGKSGTSCTAMMFLSNWLDGFGRTGRLPISSRYLSGKSGSIREHGEICDALHRGGVAVVRLYHEEAHYVLMTGDQDGCILLFDPYYEEEEAFEGSGVTVTTDHPTAYNRMVPFSFFNRTDRELYSLGEIENREAVLLFNEQTKLTDEKTIEYFI